MVARELLVIFLVSLAVPAVRPWFSCAEVEYCQRIRNGEAEDIFELGDEDLETGEDSVRAVLKNSKSGKNFSLELTALAGGSFRVLIDDPDNPRHRVQDVLDGDPKRASLELQDQTSEGFAVVSGDYKAVFETSPFRLQFYHGQHLLATANNRGLLKFEEEEPTVAISLDFYFHGAQRAYGLPSHADRLSLRTTKPGAKDPYRFYNIDHANYEAEDTQAVYGAIPVLYAHSAQVSSGVFWQNSAQTFVDIDNRDDGVEAWFYSESGVIDFFFLFGPGLKDAVGQYADLTGVAPVPQYFALGYHQSRYSYMTQEDVETVVKEFDNHNFPLDVIWLDIDYTDGKRYFTWHPENFNDPIGLQEFLNGTGRKLVGIIDPHYYVERGYFVWDEAEAAGYFVKNANGESYQGECWPGTSSWIDYFNPEARAFYAGLFAFDRFNGSTEIMHIWNDMNEPAVFEGYEGSMPKDNVHYGGWKHRDVHNQYGFYQTMGTYEGMIARLDGKQRPFILTRSHFAGSQRYTAIWTGDSGTSWEQLKISIPMCLSSALGGLGFCGADIGGFLGNPSEELLQRWYQAAAWTPFFRQHSAIDVDRREPYLYSETVQERIRYVINLRYFHLPYWYTVFYEHYRTGEPVIKPVIFNYPQDPNALDIDHELFVGDRILASPVLEEGASAVSVYLPGGADQYWYDVENTLLYTGNGYVSISVDLSSNVYFYKGGTIVPRRDTVRSASVYTHADPINLYVFLDGSGQANGTLYVDDTTTFEYQNKVYLYQRFTYADGTLSSENIDDDSSYEGSVTLGSMYVYRPPSGFKGAKLETQKRDVRELRVTYGPEEKYLKIEGVDLDLKETFSIKLYS